MQLKEKSILLTGANGFLGQHVHKELREHQPKVIHTFSSKEFDLTKEDDVETLLIMKKPNIVIHLAAQVGGIGINRLKPGAFYYKNLMMGALLMEHARRNYCEKFVAIGTICAYPKHTPIPFKEEDLWEGFPEETNAPYGIAKKAMLVQAQAYRQEFGFNAIYLLPVNLYGPGDNFNPESSHVIPALIKKCIDARESGASSIECWGTGTATREFLFVKDAAKAIVMATERYDEGEPVNIGNGQEIMIAELVEIIAKQCRFTGKIDWDPSFPDGQPRRCLDTRRAKEKFGFTATTAIADGLAETIEWYERQRQL